jgi:hypothetical protein
MVRGRVRSRSVLTEGGGVGRLPVHDERITNALAPLIRGQELAAAAETPRPR